jgi:glutaminyl-peptide cyclotransferase
MIGVLMRYSKTDLLFLLLIFFIGFTSADAELRNENSHYAILKSTKAPVASVKIVRALHHDTESFTEGLVYYKGYLYESTGLIGKSALRKVDIKFGKVIKEIKLGAEYFGEGMAILDNKIYQLTWRNQTGFIYDLSTFKQIGKFFYRGEGWGLATDGKVLFMSDGSAEITVIDPVSFAVLRKIKVSDGGALIKNLNELEFVRGEIWANVFMEDIIARISVKTGKVLGWVDLSVLSSELPVSAKKDVLNGIAYDRKGDRIFVTGKFWPKLFEIKIQSQMHY